MISASGEGAGERRLVDDQQLVRPKAEATIGRGDLVAVSIDLGGPIGVASGCRDRTLRSQMVEELSALRPPVAQWFRGSISRCSHTRHSNAADSSCAAFADGANPITEPGPWSASHTALSARMVVVLPDPAGPTSTSTRRPDVAIAVDRRALVGASVVVVLRPSATR